ncbi:MAG TPA: hypothetical protein VLE44_03165 [Candidatus Saccharimonadales bacterium]|nr:hypothetical protein [Candidatus Saccharimonadales bacterium]
MEDKENSEQVPEKIQKILDQLQNEQGQSVTDERSKEVKANFRGIAEPTDEEQLKINMEISHNLLTLSGYAQLWEARPKMGTPEEADELMKLGFLKMKNELYKDMDVSTIDKGIDYTLQKMNENTEKENKPQSTAVLIIIRNRGVLHEENK